MHASFTTTNILTRKESYGRRHFSFQPLSLLRKALSRLLSGCRKFGQPLAKNTVCWHSALQPLASGWGKTLSPELWWSSGRKTGERLCYCSVLYCVLKLYTVISTLKWAVLTGLVLSHWAISLCLDSFVFISVYSVCIVVVLLWARWGGPDEIEA